MTISFVNPGLINITSGGTKYNKKMIQQLRNQDIQVELIEVNATYPFVSRTKRIEFQNTLSQLSDIVMIDGLATGLFSPIEEKPNNQTWILLLHNRLARGQINNSKERKLLYKIEQELIHQVDAIICTSLYTFESLSNSKFSLNTVVIPPGKPDRILQQSTVEETRLLSVGSIIPLKNSLSILQTLQDLDCSVQLDIIGSIQDKNYYEILKNELIKDSRHKINIHGYVDNLRKFYAKADIFIHLPLRESFGMVLSEAMAADLPIIASNIDGIPYTLGNAGLLVPPRKISQITKELEKVIHNKELEKKLRDNSHTRYDQLPTWQNSGKRLKLFLEDSVWT